VKSSPPSLPSYEDDPFIGRMLADRYEILSVIGIGGWSTVYMARDQVLNRIVAIKLLHQQHALDPQRTQRFLQEAQAASIINHPNVATIYDVGKLPDGRSFIIMELVEGTTLADLIAQKHEFSVEEALPLFAQVCDGMAESHRHGLIHRDLKPSNIMITDQGNAKVLDFGIAKWILKEGSQLTNSNETLGTPAYMSPEQCRSEALEASSDIYALGCVMYEAMTGHAAFAESDPLVCMSRQLTATPPPFAATSVAGRVPAQLESAIFKCLAKNPANRFASMSDVRAELLACSQSLADAASGKTTNNPSLSVRSFMSSTLALITLLSFVIFLIAENNRKTQRLIKFPADHSVGTVLLVERDDNGNMQGRTTQGKAQGTVSVPKPAIVMLDDITAADAHNLDFVSSLNVDDVQYLKLSGAKIDAKSLPKLSRLKGLQLLRLDNTNVTDDDLEGIELPDLSAIDLADTGITDRGLSTIASSMGNLNFISLAGTNVSNLGLLTLANLRILKTLNLARLSLIGDRGMAVLPQLKHLQVLRLADDNITDAALANLVSAKNLTSLDLSGTSVSDATVDKLASMRALRQLNVNNTKITADGYKRLKSALPNCTIK